MTNSITNKDLQRQNKASSLVSAVMHSNVVHEGIISIEEIINMTSDEGNIQKMKNSLLAIAKISRLIKDANQHAKNKYCSCSTYIKKGAVDIANRETRTIKEAIRTNEVYSLNSNLHHYNTTIVEHLPSIKSITNAQYCPLISEETDTDSTINSTVNTHVSEQSDIPMTIVTNTQSTNIKSAPKKKQPKSHKSPSKEVLKAFMLPSPYHDRDHYSPLQAVKVIIKKADKLIRAILDLPRVGKKYVIRKVTKRFVIDLMIRKKLIPVQSSTMYSMINTYLSD